MAKVRGTARGTEQEGQPEGGEGEGEGMTTTTCSQTKREGGEQHGQCKFKDSERKENLQIYNAPELAWDLDVHTIAVKSKRSG